MGKYSDVAYFRSWYERQEASLVSRPTDATSIAVAAHFISVDATNGNMLMGSKLMGCELESVYIADPDQVHNAQLPYCLASRRSFSDVLRARDSSTEGAHSLLDNHLLKQQTMGTCTILYKEL